MCDILENSSFLAKNSQIQKVAINLESKNKINLTITKQIYSNTQRLLYFLGINPEDHISSEYLEEKDKAKKIARGYKVTEPQGPASATPATEDLVVDEQWEAAVPDAVAVEEDMELQLESDSEQNNADFVADLNNSWEADTPVERNAGVGRRVLPSRTVSVSSVTDDQQEPVLPRYVHLQDE